MLVYFSVGGAQMANQPAVKWSTGAGAGFISPFLSAEKALSPEEFTRALVCLVAQMQTVTAELNEYGDRAKAFNEDGVTEAERDALVADNARLKVEYERLSDAWAMLNRRAPATQPRAHP